jgi:acyl dehydratase
MPSVILEHLDCVKDYVGRELGVSEWLPVTQDRIDKFADATGDHQWIHVDTERAKRESPFGSTIAHGFLTLSLISPLYFGAVAIKTGYSMGVIYGLNRLRFLAPIKVGSEIRARFSVVSVKENPGSRDLILSVVVEVKGLDKPACVAEWIIRYYA